MKRIEVALSKDLRNPVNNYSIYEKLKSLRAKIGVIGLGYVGLPLALEFSKDFEVIGFDINESRIKLMKRGIDHSGEVTSDSFKRNHLILTSHKEMLDNAEFYIVTVPTPVNSSNDPDLTPLISACKSLGASLRRGNIVVFESTVYPGCTEEVCVPILESASGLKYNIDFKVGYSPERINPGDKKNTLTSIKKIVSGSDESSAVEIYQIYNHIIEAGIHLAPSIKVAEASKVIENAQRDVNIAFMNELSILFNALDINTHDVLEAAGTKWNFLKFYPGLVGGHCIGVDPYYLLHKADQHKVDMPLIKSSRAVNDNMVKSVSDNIIRTLFNNGKQIKGSKILLLGGTFKPNVSDIRNSKPLELFKNLEGKGAHVELIDPMINYKDLKLQFNITLSEKIKDWYDVIIYAVDHQKFLFITSEVLLNKMNTGGIFYDFTRRFKDIRERTTEINYVSL